MKQKDHTLFDSVLPSLPALWNSQLELENDAEAMTVHNLKMQPKVRYIGNEEFKDSFRVMVSWRVQKQKDYKRRNGSALAQYIEWYYTHIQQQQQQPPPPPPFL